ncbi:hypothetical protein [Aeromicrobium sp. CF3.5]|uniref:hypothetical protein n=1 Tax=Aeromicrobium sp. CF3.5 TaxID=3373078 RepID=UPI003EE6FA9A
MQARLVTVAAALAVSTASACSTDCLTAPIGYAPTFDGARELLGVEAPRILELDDRRSFTAVRDGSAVTVCEPATVGSPDDPCGEPPGFTTSRAFAPLVLSSADVDALDTVVAQIRAALPEPPSTC